MSATVEIPQIHLSNATDAILQDPRLDWLTDRVAKQWHMANEEKADGRRKEHRNTEALSATYARHYLGYAAELHCRRALKALRAGKDMPLKPTKTQEGDGLRAEDLPEMNLMLRQMIGQHILLLADAMGSCAVMFADPVEVAERIQL